MKKLITGLVAIAAFTFSASAQQGSTDGQRNWDRNGQHQGRGDRGMMGLEQLNLSDAQKQQIKSINEDFRAKMQALDQNENITVKDQKAQKESLMQERRNKISSILTPEQKTQFEQLSSRDGNRDFGGRGDFGQGRDGERQGGENRLNELKTQLNLTDDQAARIKASNESFKEKARAIRENSSLNEDQKKAQFEQLQKERKESLKSFLTADQIAKLEQMKHNGNWNGKGDWKEKRKDKDGKEKTKIKTT